MLNQNLAVTKALTELDAALPDDFPIIELKIVGGYALQLTAIRTDENDITDLDYIGPSFPHGYSELINEIGLKHKLANGWINNDVVYADNGLEIIEHTTGPLKFDQIPTQLKHFQVSVIDGESALRMKLAALDDQFITYLDDGEVVRFRDLPDIALLCEKLDESAIKRAVAQVDLMERWAVERALFKLRSGITPLQILPQVRAEWLAVQS